VKVQLLALNDFHGQLAPPAAPLLLRRDEAGKPVRVDAGGVAFLAEHIARLRAENPRNTLVVSAGDLVGASPLVSALFHDEPTIEAMNALGLDLAAVGNHEFDEGRAELLRLQKGGCHPKDGCQDGTPFPGARFSFLAANVVDTATGESLFPPYAIRTFEGVKVAFIGMTLEGTPSIVTPSGVAGLRFLDEVETANRLVPRLQAQGVQAIVVLLHEGGEQAPGGPYDGCEQLSGPIVEIARALSPAVDVVLSAHTHQAYDCVIAGKRVTSAASMGRLVTDLDLTLDAASGEVLEVKSRQVVIGRDVPPVPAQEALVARYQALTAPLERRPVGFVQAALSDAGEGAGATGESALGDVIADAQLEATRAQGAQLSFMNPGGIRAELDAGEVTYGEVFTVHPFGNTLVTLSLTGRELHQLLEQQWLGSRVRILSPSQGFTYTWRASAPGGAKVDPASLHLAGVPVRPEQSYRVTVNSFLAAGGDGFTVLPEARERVGGPVDVDALEAYLGAHNPLPAPALGRVQRRP
jgi:5'-nucleotidase